MESRTRVGRAASELLLLGILSRATIRKSKINWSIIMRTIVYAVVAAIAILEVGAVQAATWTIAPPGTDRSKEIKSMNIMDRPNRPLHFYGDIVRLANRRR
jgi:hypothetical protein